MKKIFYLTLFMTIVSCQMSDTSYELPLNYIYYEEGLYSNIVVRNDTLVIDHGAFDFSYDDNYIMFVYDTTDIARQPQVIKNTTLSFFVHDIINDSIYRQMNFIEYKKFIIKNQISKSLDLSIRNYSKYNKQMIKQ